jgi:hypothetical protein
MKGDGLDVIPSSPSGMNSQLSRFDTPSELLQSIAEIRPKQGERK